MTIPVIVRLGNLQAKAGISNVALEKKDGKIGDLARPQPVGHRARPSARCEVLKPGVKDPIAIQKAVAVYTEVGNRHVSIPVDDNYKGEVAGPVTVQYIETYRGREREDRRDPGGSAVGSGQARRRAVVLGGRNWLRKAAMLLALSAGGLAASAPANRPQRQWTADPDDQFLLDVHIRQLVLGDGVRAYNAPEGHMCRLRRLFDRARRADAHRSDREKGERLGVQGKQPDHHRLFGDAATYGAKSRGDRAGNDPRDARRLVRPGERRLPAGSGSA